MAGVEPPDSPVWVAAEPDAPARVDEGEDAEAASPRDREDGAVLALGLGEDSDVASASGLETGAQALAPGAALPDWANDALSDGSSSDDEPECNICRLTAEEMGEPLIVVCSCTTMPVHLSCGEMPPVLVHPATLLCIRSSHTATDGAGVSCHRSGGLASAVCKSCVCSPLSDVSRTVSAPSFAACHQRGRRPIR